MKNYECMNITDINNITSTALLNDALRAICFTRDYVGRDILPAISGWEWYDVGCKICDYLSITDDNNEWVNEFRMRVNLYNNKKIKRN